MCGQAPGSKVHVTGIPFDVPARSDCVNGWELDRDTFYDVTQIAKRFGARRRNFTGESIWERGSFTFFK